MKNNIQQDIPTIIIESLLDTLIKISEYSTVNGGDITTRNHEALGNTLIAFYNDDLMNDVQKRINSISLSGSARDFLSWSISLVKKCNNERKCDMTSLQESFINNLVDILQKHPLPSTIKTEAQLEEEIYRILCDHLRKTPDIRVDKLEETIFTHGKTKEEKDRWTQSKFHQNVNVYGCSNTSDIFIKHPDLKTIYVELKLSKKRPGISSSSLPGDLQRSIGQSIIASLRHSYVICLIVCEINIELKDNDLSEKLQDTLRKKHKIALIVRGIC